MNFQWKPHQGPDLEAIGRMKQHFPKPTNDPPEAWFMSREQKYYSGLLEALTTNLDLAYVQEYLFDVGVGLEAFGRFEEWAEWFLFLLPYLLEHILEGELLCSTINYFLNLYPHHIPDEYPGFRADALQTLGQVAMSDSIWTERANDEWYFGEFLYAALFFCLKYLKPNEIGTWITSVSAIQDATWRLSLSTWMQGLKRFLYLIQHPDELPVPVERLDQLNKHTIEYPLKIAGINWLDSHVAFARPYSSLPDYLPNLYLPEFWKGLENEFKEAR